MKYNNIKWKTRKKETQLESYTTPFLDRDGLRVTGMWMGTVSECKEGVFRFSTRGSKRLQTLLELVLRA